MKRAFAVLFNVAMLLSVLVICLLVPVERSYPVKNHLALWLYEWEQYEAAHALLLLLANQGYAPSANNLGALYHLGIGVQQRFSEAAVQYEAAAAAGLAAAQYNLARLYERGLGVPRNLEKAEALLRSAADQGDSFAGMTLASFLQLQRRPDWQKRKLTLLQKLAERGYAEAQYALAMQEEGLAEASSAEGKEFSAAADWLERAAKKGHGPAQARLASLYGTSNPTLALEWLRRAADRGEAAAQIALAARYARGEGVEQNDERAVFWYREAAAAPEREERESRLPSRAGSLLYALPHPKLRLSSWEPVQIARTALADHYLSGRGLPRDPLEAARIYRIAAEAGWGSAAAKLAMLFEEGRGVPKNRMQALRWLRAALETGYEEAMPRFQALQAEIGRERSTAEPRS